MAFYRKERKYTEDNIQIYLRQWIQQGCKNKFYGTALWEEKRNEILERDHHLCQNCLRYGVMTSDDLTVHHIYHLEQRPDLCLDSNFLLSVCPFCHKVIHRGLYNVLDYWKCPPAWAQNMQIAIKQYQYQQYILMQMYGLPNEQYQERTMHQMCPNMQAQIAYQQQQQARVTQ